MTALDVRMARSGKAKNRVALDVGSHSVKLIEVTPGAEKPTLVSFGIKKVHGMPRDAVVASIKSLAEDLRICAKDLCVSLSGPQVIARLISMPKMSSDELKSAVRFEVEKLIPYDINECIIDFQVVSEQASKGKNSTEVLLAAARKDQVMQKIKLVEDAGFGVRIVDVDSFAVANAFVAGYAEMEEPKTVAILNVGAAFTNLSIVKGSVVSVVRDIAIGGNDLSAAIAKKLGLAASAAEELKVSPRGKEAEAAELMRPVLMNLFDEIKLSFGYHENQSGRGIDEVYVSGGSVDAAGFDDAFAEALGSKALRWDPFRFLSVPDVDTAALGSLRSSFSVAVGLAMR